MLPVQDIEIPVDSPMGAALLALSLHGAELRLSEGPNRRMTVSGRTGNGQVSVTFTGSPYELRYAQSGDGGGSDHDHDDDYAAKDHDHDTVYSKKTHAHDTVYSKKTHAHDTVYAKKVHVHGEYAADGHDHDDDYSGKDHDHDLDYAGKTHAHDTVYAKKVHAHDGYADDGHDHDDEYAAMGHEHETQLDYSHTTRIGSGNWAAWHIPLGALDPSGLPTTQEDAQAKKLRLVSAHIDPPDDSSDQFFTTAKLTVFRGSTGDLEVGVHVSFMQVTAEAPVPETYQVPSGGGQQGAELTVHLRFAFVG